jgi:hypothetical protein
MKMKYSQPTTKVILIKGENHFLIGSNEGVQATMSGYSQDEDDGFTQ